MKLGVMFANTRAFATAEGARALGAAAEAAGFESLWTVEHVVVPKDYRSAYPYDRSGKMPGGDDLPIPDPLVWLTYMAAVTTRVRLATGVLILPQRQPLVLAKECATLDQLSGGRLLLGVGAGWLEEEFQALGVPFAARGRRVDDYVGALRAAWGAQPASYDGRFTRFEQVHVAPQPVGGQVPIVVGGHSEAAARRAGRLGDGFFPGRGSERALRGLIDTMRAAAEEAGRDPDAVEITAPGIGVLGPDPADALGRLAEVGVRRVVVPPPTYDLDRIGDALAELADRVGAPA